MPAHYPELDPPQHASFPVPVGDLPGSGADFFATLRERALEDPFLVLSALAFLGVLVHGFVGRSLRLASQESEHAPTRGWRLWRSRVLAWPHAALVLWLPFLLVAAWAIHGGSEALRFFFLDGRHRFLWHLAVVTFLTLSRPGQLLLELILTRVAQALGANARSWWITLVVVAPLLGSLCSVVGLLPVTCRLLGLHVHDGRSRRVGSVTDAIFYTNLSLVAGVGLAAGHALPAAPWDFVDIWRSKSLLAIGVVSLLGAVFVWAPLRLSSRIPPVDSRSEKGGMHPGLALLVGGLLLALPFLVENPGWLIAAPLALAVLLSTLEIDRPLRRWPLAIPLLLLCLLWVPLGKGQHGWTSLVVEALPGWGETLCFGLLAALVGAVGGHALVPQLAANEVAGATIGVLAFGGLGLATYATWLGATLSEARRRPDWKWMLLAGGLAALVLSVADRV